jgi:hypothetical protein
VIALGGHAHSEPLRTWALRELQGYEGTDVPIPDYRRIPAPLVMDGLMGMFQFREQPVSIFDLYWAVHPSAMEGVLDHVRTRLVQLVGELRAAMPHGQQDPTSDQVAQALQNINIVTGDNSFVTVTAPVAVAHRRGSARAEIGGAAQRTFPWMLLAWITLIALVMAAVVSAWVEWA